MVIWYTTCCGISIVKLKISSMIKFIQFPEKNITTLIMIDVKRQRTINIWQPHKFCMLRSPSPLSAFGTVLQWRNHSTSLTSSSFVGITLPPSQCGRHIWIVPKVLYHTCVWNQWAVVGWISFCCPSSLLSIPLFLFLLFHSSSPLAWFSLNPNHTENRGLIW